MKKLFLAFFVLLFSSGVFALVEKQEMTVLAVTNAGEGLGAKLLLDIDEGTGKVWVSAEPLVGTTTQSAAQAAVKLAKNYSTDVSMHDYKFSIESTASVVEGPSAGAAMALLVISSFQDKKVPSNVALTGTIDEEGNVGPVGGVFEKSKEAARIGLKLFLIPKGEAAQTVRDNGVVKSINLVEYGPKELGMTIIEVSTIDDVLSYAFTDIDSIDIEEIISQSEVPEFIPKPISFDPHLQAMKDLTNSYVAETKVIIEEARNAVSSTIIDDVSVMNTLLDIINSSEQLVHDAENLNSQNYLYSAANFAFLARVNALLAKDISNNPSLLSLSSSALDLKIQSLQSEVSDLEESLDSDLSLDSLEWFVSAQQRLSYAKLSLERLSTTQTIIINGEESPEVAIQRVTDYEFAVAWIDVAKDFYSVSKSSKNLVRANSEFKNLSDTLISEAENSYAAVVTDAPLEDIERRLDAAVFENSKEWFIASIVDAATAKALSEAETATSNKSQEELFAFLQEKISSLEGQISSSEYSYSWPVLYLDHAKYFLEASIYYSSQNENSRAINSLRSGISLALLAQEVFSSLEQVNEYYSTVKPFVPNNRLVFPGTGEETPTVQVTQPVIPANTALLLVILLVFVFGFLFVFFSLKIALRPQTVPSSYRKELLRVNSLRSMADKALFTGKISEDKHSEIVFLYQKELERLEKLRELKAKELVELEEFRQNLLSLDRKMLELKQHFKEDIILEEEFFRRKDFLKKEFDGISEKLGLPQPMQKSKKPSNFGQSDLVKKALQKKAAGKKKKNGKGKKKTENK